MRIALGINVVMLAGGLIGGLLIGSLALLADAGHVLSDVGALALGLFAASLAMRPAGPDRTFGFQRSEVLAALVNGVALVIISVLIAVEALSRFGDPPEVAGAGVLAIGLIGLGGNLVATLVLAGGEREDLNLEGVLRHSLADALGSLGVVVSGVVLLVTGWDAVDPIAGLVIAALILLSSWRLIAEPVHVLMEGAPRGVDVAALGKAMCTQPGVVEVHDLHVWTVTSGFPALAAHVVVEQGADRDLVRNRLERLVKEEAGIEHTTLQMVEPDRTGELVTID